MSNLRFIHAADIHLGSLLHVNLAADDKLRGSFDNSILDAFAKIVDAAIRAKVDFLLLAGDVYDSHSRSVKANNFFYQECHRLAEHKIDVYMIAGNHDPLAEQKKLFKLPDNLYIFSDREVEERLIKREGRAVARILGLSYAGKSDSRRVVDSFQATTNDTFNIALLHTQLEANNKNYLPCSVQDLKSNNSIDYWALGHIHQFRVINQQGPMIAYPGIPQGRDFGELGVGGALLIEVDQFKNISYEFLITSSLIFKQLELDLDDLEVLPNNLDELQSILVEQVKKLLEEELQSDNQAVAGNGDFQEELRGYIIKWVISGHGTIHYLLEEEEEELKQLLLDRLRREFMQQEPLVWSDDLEFRTAPPLPKLETLAREDLFFKEIQETIEELQNNLQLKSELVDDLGEIWSADLDGVEDDWERFKLDDDALEDILVEAKNLLIAEILERRS